MNETSQELVYGTCVAFGSQAALLRGPSGAGKSDLALRFLSLPAQGGVPLTLVADDQVLVRRSGADRLFAAAPPTIAGKIEVRGLGIIEMPYLKEAELVLIADLVSIENMPRFPLEARQAMIAGRALPSILLAPFESSAPLKLQLALREAARKIAARPARIGLACSAPRVEDSRRGA